MENIIINLERVEISEDTRRLSSVCVISQDVITEHFFLQCGHKFQKENILKWLETSNTCPICRKEQINLQKNLTWRVYGLNNDYRMDVEFIERDDETRADIYLFEKKIYEDVNDFYKSYMWTIRTETVDSFHSFHPLNFRERNKWEKLFLLEKERMRKIILEEQTSDSDNG